MIWVKSKRFLLPLAVLLFLSSVCLSAEQADITKAELLTLLNERENFKTELATLKAESESIKAELATLKTESMKREQELAILKLESQIRTDLLMTLEKEMVWTKATWFFSGLLGGYSLNELKEDLLP